MGNYKVRFSLPVMNFYCQARYTWEQSSSSNTFDLNTKYYHREVPKNFGCSSSRVKAVIKNIN